MKNDRQESYNLPLTILENERSRITRELHDTTIQNLVHLIHQIELASHYIDEDPVRAKLELSTLSKNLKETITETRNIIYDLKPMAITDLGFKEALDEYISYLNTFSDVKFMYNITDDFDKIDNGKILIIYRIIQEACNNIVKHSKATDASININKYKDSFYKISIDDNGIGCKKEDINKTHHYGLEIIEERVKMISGSLEIHTNLKKGFHITVIIPMES
ncbi:MAG: sensor histidine kinase [Lachnospiraceae bacterium]|nr:sensor histidine kinase [Lachnospiraceae bacterium]